jgi:hypothetical protein
MFATATVDLTRTGLTTDDLRGLIRGILEGQRDRRVVYLRGEIARLRARTQHGDSALMLASHEAELADVDASIARQLAPIDASKMPIAPALSYLGAIIREKAYADKRYTPEQQAELDGFGAPDLLQAIAAYKARPLGGMWASPPYLHNGSVPTLYDLLSPVADRPKTFRVGSREFDTERVGLAQKTNGFWIFDTSLPGNSNAGHEFNTGYVPWTVGSPPQNGLIGPLLTHEDRLALIEHLKVRNDDAEGKLTDWVPRYQRCAIVADTTPR